VDLAAEACTSPALKSILSCRANWPAAWRSGPNAFTPPTEARSRELDLHVRGRSERFIERSCATATALALGADARGGAMPRRPAGWSG
jgi:hypothetical protein